MERDEGQMIRIKISAPTMGDLLRKLDAFRDADRVDKPRRHRQYFIATAWYKIRTRPAQNIVK